MAHPWFIVILWFDFYSLFDSCITVSPQLSHGQPICATKWPLTVNAVWTDGWLNLCDKGCSHCLLLLVHMYSAFTDRLPQDAMCTKSEAPVLTGGAICYCVTRCSVDKFALYSGLPDDLVTRAVDLRSDYTAGRVVTIQVCHIAVALSKRRFSVCRETD